MTVAVGSGPQREDHPITLNDGPAVRVEQPLRAQPDANRFRPFARDPESQA